MCNKETVFTKSAQKSHMLQFYSVYPFHWHCCHSSCLRVGDFDFSNLKGHDAMPCIFPLFEESHLAVGGWVYIETPARKMALSHTYFCR